MIDPRKGLKNKTILVTGGAGFIGSHLCDRLLRYGAKVICFDDLSTGSRDYVESKKEDRNFVFIKGDANKFSDISRVFSAKSGPASGGKKYPIDYVFHYAAVVGVQRTVEEPMKVLADIEGIKHLLKLCPQYKVKKIVYASSSEVYGNQEKMPLHEEESYLDIRMPYALVKSAGENYFRAHWEITGLPITILRFFNVYGPRQESSRYGFVTGIFISQALNNQKPTIFHDGAQTRDFMYIDDNIESSIQALLNPKADGHAINLGTGRETTILELAQKIIALSKKNLRPSLMHKRNFLEIKRRVAHNGKMIKILGYRPKYSLEKGLGLTYRWYQERPRLISKHNLSYGEYKKGVWRPLKDRLSKA